VLASMELVECGSNLPKNRDTLMSPALRYTP